MRINVEKWAVYLPLWFSSSSFLFALYCGEEDNFVGTLGLSSHHLSTLINF